jgi:hypothetical protein
MVKPLPRLTAIFDVSRINNMIWHTSTQHTNNVPQSRHSEAPLCSCTSFFDTRSFPIVTYRIQVLIFVVCKLLLLDRSA